MLVLIEPKNYSENHHEIAMRSPGFEPGLVTWQATVLDQTIRQPPRNDITNFPIVLLSVFNFL